MVVARAGGKGSGELVCNGDRISVSQDEETPVAGGSDSCSTV